MSEPLPQPVAPEAAQPQQAAPAPDAFALSPQGELVRLDPAQLGLAQGQGYVPLSRDEAERVHQVKTYGDRGLEAGAAGLARSLTLSGSDVALTASGLVAPETLKGLAEQNKGATLAGELTGVVAPALLTEGGSAAAQGAGAVKTASRARTFLETLAAPARAVSEVGAVAREAAGGKALGALAQGAAEGGLYGAGSALSESVIEDKPLTAEALLSHVGPAALFGGVGGATLEGALGLAASKAPSALEKASAGLEKLAVRVEESGAGAKVEHLEAALEKARPQLERGLEEAQAVRRELVDTALTGAPARELGDVSGQLRASIDKLAHDTPARSLGDRVLSRLQSGLEKAESAGQQVAAIEGAVATLTQRVARGGENLAPLAGVRNQLQATLQSEALWGPAAKIQQEFGARVAALEQAESKLGSLKASGGAKAAVKEAAEGDPLRIQALKDYTTAARDLVDHASEASAELPTGRRNIASLRSAAEHVQGAADDAVKASTPGMLEGLEHFLPHAIQGPLGMVGHLTRESEVVAQALHRTAKVTGQIAKLVRSGLEGKTAEGAGLAAGVLSGHHYGTEAGKGEGRADALARHAADHAAIASTPASAMAQRMVDATPTLGKHLPGVALPLQQKAQQAQQYLAAQMPKTTRQPSGLPGEPKWQPSEVELMRYERISRAVERPLSILEDLGAGRLSADSVRAVQTIWPELYKQMTTQVSQALAERTERVPYAQRLQLSILLNTPLDPSLQMLPQLQANASQATSGQPKQGTQPATARPVNLGQANRAATPLNRSSP